MRSRKKKDVLEKIEKVGIKQDEGKRGNKKSSNFNARK